MTCSRVHCSQHFEHNAFIFKGWEIIELALPPSITSQKIRLFTITSCKLQVLKQQFLVLVLGNVCSWVFWDICDYQHLLLLPPSQSYFWYVSHNHYCVPSSFSSSKSKLMFSKYILSFPFNLSSLVSSLLFFLFVQWGWLCDGCCIL
jgi:hypothetical protein